MLFIVSEKRLVSKHYKYIYIFYKRESSYLGTAADTPDYRCVCVWHQNITNTFTSFIKENHRTLVPQQTHLITDVFVCDILSVQYPTDLQQ